LLNFKSIYISQHKYQLKFKHIAILFPTLAAAL